VPPSANKLLRELGLRDAVEAAGFEANLGNTVWWAGRPGRVEAFTAVERGVHVERRRLEDVLVRAAEAAGVRVYEGYAAREAREDAGGWTVACRAADGTALELRAPWIVDATGRRGFLARREGREPDPRTATLALLARFRMRGGWRDAEPGHTLVESWADGWAWSVPLDAEVRCFAAMVDRQSVASSRDKRAAMRASLEQAPHLGGLAAAADPMGSVWACSASLYGSRRYARPGLLLAGDAGSFIDPLSSFGVKKAISSGWLAGVALHTALVDSPLASVALDFFDRREREVYSAYRRGSATFYREAAEVYGSEHWLRRAEAAREAGVDESAAARYVDSEDSTVADLPEADVRRAYEGIRERARLQAIRGGTLRTFRGPAIDGHRIVLEDQLASDVCPRGARFARGVDLRRLVEEAPRHQDVPEVWAAYNRVAAPVSLPDFLAALAVAFAAGFLEHRDR
jgi:flavin-dependent dehydrogenase